MDRRDCVHAQAMHRCSLKPDRPTTCRHTAVSQAMPARPLAPRCCLTRLTHLPRRRPHCLASARPLGARAVFQVHRRDWGSPVACTRRAVLPPAVGCGHRRQRLRGIAGTGTWYILLWKFPTYAPIAVEQRCSSACVEGYGEEG